MGQLGTCPSFGIKLHLDYSSISDALKNLPFIIWRRGWIERVQRKTPYSVPKGINRPCYQSRRTKLISMVEEHAITQGEGGASLFHYCIQKLAELECP
jgi:hypothetical protein